MGRAILKGSLNYMDTQPAVTLSPAETLPAVNTHTRDGTEDFLSLQWMQAFDRLRLTDAHRSKIIKSEIRDQNLDQTSKFTYF
jgi:hypothetical protein